MIRRFMLILFLATYGIFLQAHNELNKDEFSLADSCELYSIDCPVRPQDEEPVVEDVEEPQKEPPSTKINTVKPNPVEASAVPISKDSVQDKIIEQAKEYGVNQETALRIASCESGFNPHAANKHSTAKGVYQFLNGTWDGYCEGSVYDADANIKCFMELYPRYPQWWECK